mmetsp:Transcript_2255/g.3790  ORF Transcript_2255/g.3790 Transcript_2255/m.3790 type:complete len:407 (-) Transcript_2255:331-1551(-)
MMYNIYMNSNFQLSLGLWWQFYRVIAGQGPSLPQASNHSSILWIYMDKDASKYFVDHVFFVDEVARALNQAQQLRNIRVPVGEHALGRARLGEGHHAARPVHLRPEAVLAHQGRQVRLRLIFCKLQVLRKPFHPDLLVVLCNSANIVLDDAHAEVGGPGAGAVGARAGQRRVPRQRRARAAHRPPDELRGGEPARGLLEVGHALQRPAQPLHPLQHVRLLVAVGAEHQEEHAGAQRGVRLLRVRLHAGGVVDLVVVLRDGQGVVLVLVVPDHQLVEPHLDLLHLVLLQDLAVELAAVDHGAHVVLARQREPQLLQDELRLLLLAHGAVGLHMHLAHAVAGRLDVPVRLVDVGEDPGQLRPLGLEEDLPVRDVAQRNDERHLGVLGRRLWDPLHRSPHHTSDRLGIL